MDLTQVRQFVDGELSPDEAGVVERAAAADATLAARIAFERTLREHTAVVMEAGSIPAPTEVREQVEQVVAEEVAQSSGDHQAIPFAEGNPSVIRVNYFAVAACLAIVVGAVLFGIFGSPLHELGGAGTQPDQVATMAAEARTEHTRCTTDSAVLDDKMKYRTWTSIQANLSHRLRTTVPVLDLTSLGYELVGGGECQLGPTPETSIHVVYRETNGPARISLFMQPDVGQSVAFSQGEVYGPGGQWAASIIAPDGRIVIVLVACRTDDGMTAKKLIGQQLDRR